MIEAETEKIRIMEELWQARHSGRKTEQNYKLLLLINKQEGVKLPPEPPGHCSKELQVTNPSKFSKGHVTRHVASSCQERLTLLSVKRREEFSESWKFWWPDACVHLTALSHFHSHFNLGRPPSAPTAAMAAQGKHLEGPFWALRWFGGEVLLQGPPLSWSVFNTVCQNTALFQKPGETIIVRRIAFLFIPIYF